MWKNSNSVSPTDGPVAAAGRGERGAGGGRQSQVRVGGPQDRRHLVQDQVHRRLSLVDRLLRLLALLLQPPPQLELGHDLTGERPQRVELRGCQLPRDTVEDAEGAERVAVRGQERRPRVEPHVRLAAHEGVVRETLVGRDVRHDHHVVFEDGVPAEGDGAWRLRRRQSRLWT